MTDLEILHFVIEWYKFWLPIIGVLLVCLVVAGLINGWFR